MRSEFAGAYTEEAACKSYVRTLRLADSKSKSSLIIEDEYELTERKAADDIHFITPGKVVILSDGVIAIENDGEVLKMTYPSTLTPEIEEKKIIDERIGHHWDNVLYAIRFKSAADAPLTGNYRFELKMK